jgi:hypothetical protein
MPFQTSTRTPWSAELSMLTTPEAWNLGSPVNADKVGSATSDGVSSSSGTHTPSSRRRT